VNRRAELVQGGIITNHGVLPISERARIV
jgi:hypothetical protein